MKRLLLITSLLLFSCNNSKSADEYLRTGQSAIADKNYKIAVIELKNALLQQPNLAEARFLLGTSYFFSEQLPAARKELQRALELGVDPNKVMTFLLRIDIFLGKLEFVEDYGQEEHALTPETIIELHTVFAGNLIVRGQITEGLSLLHKVMSFEQKHDFFYQLAKAWLAATNDQIDEAIKLTSTLSEADNEFNDALLFTARLYAFARQYELAAAKYAQFLTLHRTNFIAQMGYIEVLIATNDLDKAENQVDLLLASYPRLPSINAYKAELAFLAQRFQSATDYANIALATQPSLFKANLIAGLSYHQQQNDEMAYHHLILIENYLPPSHLVFQLLSSLKFQLGYSAEAVAKIDEFEQFSAADFQLLSNASSALIKSGERDKAKEYIEQLNELEVSGHQQLTQRGVLKLSVNDKTGIDDLKQALAENPNYLKAQIAILYNYLNNNQLSQALSFANALISNNPEEDLGYLAKGIVLQAQNYPEMAEASFRQALIKNPESIGAKFNLSTYDVQNKNYQAAYQKLVEILDKSPEHRGALERLVKLSTVWQDQQKIIDFIEQLRVAYPDKIILSLALARTFENLHQQDNGLKLLFSLQKTADNNIQYLQTYALMSYKAGGFAKAEELFTKIIGVSAKDVKAHVGLIFSLGAQNKDQQALAKIKNAQALFPDNANLVIYEANYLLKIGEVAEAESLLAVINENTVNRTLLLTANIKLNAVKNEHQRALEFAEELHRRSPNLQSSFTYAQLLQRLSQNELALTVVNKAIMKYGSSLALESLKAELSVGIHPENAVNIYQKLLKENPENPVVLNNFAWAAIMAKQYDLALEVAQKAMKLAPEQPQIKDTLALAYLRVGQYRMAETLLEEALESLPVDGDISLHYAETLIYLNKFERSKEILDKLSSSIEKQALLNLLKKHAE
ncbi:XrtA/PEP-CTERM system TPR-repeat protein PrsT [Thalassotalea sp. ND16A]|uniref:XrtA/PEP-CTERM system TPR-repeat protein PrsT n=1 Tax=Thalassotalea sp. ND16A TaxID=1535422 RepID=UPI00051A6FF6|nr:XrtA/PEP-CTERM system TPR-repeat protein PrsT [Thalassotalea sp. ND16A]KGJ98163.1 hypothetical protein ND16A_0968 [Thalassotalea sp. ND16A]